jgi:hypothetical protein
VVEDPEEVVSGAGIPRAKPRASHHRLQDTPGHPQLRSPQLDGTSGHFQPPPDTLRTLLTSEGFVGSNPTAPTIFEYHPHRESPESRKKSNRKYRISSYGLTQELFDLLLEAQQNACGMCHEPFEERQLIHVDHDHACCRGKNRSCGECIRGLLCHTRNIALGYIERRYALARAYLDSPPVVQLLDAAWPSIRKRSLRRDCRNLP